MGKAIDRRAVHPLKRHDGGARVQSRTAKRFRIDEFRSRSALTRANYLVERRFLPAPEALGVISSFVPLELVERLCDPDDPDPLGTLSGLVDRRMVRRITDGDPVTFGMLELLRQHARVLLDRAETADAVRDRHAAVVADLLDDLRQQYWSDPRSLSADLDGSRGGQHSPPSPASTLESDC